MTEKSMSLVEKRKYTFYAHPKSTKIQIKECIEKMFEGVKVASVNTMNTHPKKRRRRGFKEGKTAARKKAIISLTAESRDIELFPGL